MRLTKQILGIMFAAGVIGALGLSPASASWKSDGTPIAASDSSEDHPVIAPDGAGGAFIAWEGYEAGGWNYYVARISASGDLQPGWTSEGLEFPGPAVDGQIVPDEAGGAFVYWVVPDYVNPGRTAIAMTRVTPDGTVAPGWPSLGATLGAGSAGPAREVPPAGIESPRAYGSIEPAAVSDGAGGAVLVWTYVDRLWEFLHLQHFAGNGTVPVNWDATPLGSRFGSEPQICSDGHSGAFVSWLYGVQLQHVLGSGALDPRWPSSGVVLSPYTDSYGLSPVAQGVCPDGVGGVYAAWLERRDSPAFQCVIQHITDSSAVAPGWPAGGKVLSPYNCQAGGYRAGPYFFDQRFTSIVPDGTGGALVAWQDTRSDPGDIHVQRVLPDGNIAPGWSENGVAACVAPGTQEYPVVVGDGAGGAWVAWQDERSEFDIYAQHIRAGGSLMPGASPSGYPVCTAPGHQYQPQLVEDGSGGVILTWVDYRRGNADVYATRLGTDGVVAALISLVRADAEPAGVHLEWASSTGAGTSTEVWRRDDTHDWSLLAALEADGSGRIVFDDRTVAGGMRYWYRLRLDLDGQVRDTPEFEIDVPLQPELALERARPNPADADLFIDFSLPDARPATVELVDVQGRVRLSRSTDLGAGRHAMRLARRGELPMGMYWVRLTHGADARVVKVAVVR